MITRSVNSELDMTLYTRAVSYLHFEATLHLHCVAVYVREQHTGSTALGSNRIIQRRDGMADKDPTKIAENFITAFNDADWSGFKALLAADVRYEETGTQRQTQDADSYTHLCQGWKEAFPDAKGTIQQVAASGNTVVQEVLWEGTQTGPLVTPNGTLPASNRHIAVPATLWYTFRGDTIEAIHHHIDLMTMLQQLGAMPG